MAPTAPLLYSRILPLAGGEEGLQPTGEREIKIKHYYYSDYKSSIFRNLLLLYQLLMAVLYCYFQHSFELLY